ncbi:MAG: protein kinase family protein [Candidatus Xenobia bacterium]
MLTGTRLANPDPARYRLLERYRKGQHPIVLVQEQSSGRLLLACRVRLSLESEESRQAAQEVEDLLRGLSHPGLPRLLEVDYEKAVHAYWFMFDAVHGETLDRLVGTGSPEEVLNWMAQLLDTLAALPQPIGHLEPRTVMLGPSGIMLLDVGIQARLFPESITMELTSRPDAFVAPEQHHRSVPSAASDIYAVGAMARWLLGTSPHQALASFPEVVDMLEWMVAEDPLNRPRAADAAMALRAWLKRPEVEAVTEAEPVLPPRRRSVPRELDEPSTANPLLDLYDDLRWHLRRYPAHMAAALVLLALLAIALVPHGSGSVMGPTAPPSVLHVVGGKMLVDFPAERPEWQERDRLDDDGLQFQSDGFLHLAAQAPRVDLTLEPSSLMRLEKWGHGTLQATVLRGAVTVTPGPALSAVIHVLDVTLTCQPDSELQVALKTGADGGAFHGSVRLTRGQAAMRRDKKEQELPVGQPLSLSP